MYTNLVLTNPLHESTAPPPQPYHPTHSSTAPPTPAATASTNAFQWDNQPVERLANSGQEYTTTSLTSPLKGVIPTLMREESHSIPIPGRAQSHDDIRMFGVGSNNNSCYISPRSNYCFTPISPTGQYTCESPTNLSPPINYYSGNKLHVGGAMVARRALSRAASPLSHSVPTGVQYSSSPSSSSCRTNAVKNCSRSEPKKSKTNKQCKKCLLILCFIPSVCHFGLNSTYFQFRVVYSCAHFSTQNFLLLVKFFHFFLFY